MSFLVYTDAIGSKAIMRKADECISPNQLSLFPEPERVLPARPAGQAAGSQKDAEQSLSVVFSPTKYCLLRCSYCLSHLIPCLYEEVKR